MTLTPTGEVHPVAELFPMMTDEELADLAADITANGLLYPIVLDADGQLIDGRNRLRACQMAGVQPTYTSLNGHDPVAYILSTNVTRRHLSKGQSAMAVALSRTVSEAGKSHYGANRAAALAAGVREQRVSMAALVVGFAPELTPLVMSGAMGLDAAYEQARTRKVATDSADERARLAAEQLRQLRNVAPDLADLVVEERMTLDEAFAALREREKQEETERWAVSKTVVELLQSVQVVAGTLAVREHTLRYFDIDKARQRGAVPTAASLKEAGQQLLRLAEEWHE
jgi:hypothetical protein